MFDFLVELSDIGISSRSQARIISGLKSFYQFLILEKAIDDDPTELLELPKLSLHLPEVLSVEEINLILSQIPYVLQVIDEIAEPEFAEEVRVICKQVMDWDPPKRVKA